jgi:hypothetical protein
MFYNGHKIFFTPFGYPVIKNSDKTHSLVHVLVWEKYNGKKPCGFHIHHKDGNPKNYNISNLQLLTYVEHRRLHWGWVYIDSRWKKPCRKCGKICNIDDFGQTHTYGNKNKTYKKYNPLCKSCYNLERKMYYSKNKKLCSLLMKRYRLRRKLKNNIGDFGQILKQIKLYDGNILKTRMSA